MADLSDQIEADAAKPQSATVDGNTVTRNSLRDLIAADEYLKANDAASSEKRGFLFQRMKPPGTR